MRKISADYIFPISSEPIKNGVITVDDEGTIFEISENNLTEQSTIEKYEGIICPGFVNTHCHLELSYLKNKIAENTGIMGFVGELLKKRNDFSEEEIQQAIVLAENEMIQNGIVAVGDISNDNSTFKQKSKNNLAYHTFIEVFDLNKNTTEIFENALKLKNELQQLEASNFKLQTSIVPHAPYTVSEKLFQLISDETKNNNAIISIHNQESEAENELFISNTGAIFNTFTKMGFDMKYISKTGKNSLQSIFSKLPKGNKILLVHNTFTSKEDLQFLNSQFFFCTCPNANMFIENKLPNYNFFIEQNAKMTVGTDSLASNWSLSILDELKTIAKHFPNISLQTLLTWATKNGAEFLNFNQLGTIEKGKKPGLNLLQNVDEVKITEETTVKKLC